MQCNKNSLWSNIKNNGICTKKAVGRDSVRLQVIKSVMHHLLAVYIKTDDSSNGGDTWLHDQNSKEIIHQG